MNENNEFNVVKFKNGFYKPKNESSYIYIKDKGDLCIKLVDNKKHVIFKNLSGIIPFPMNIEKILSKRTTAKKIYEIF